MGQERAHRINEEGLTRSDRHLPITATTTLTVRDQVVDIDSSGGTAITVTLPPVSEAKGKIFAIYVTAYSGAITLSHHGDSSDLHSFIYCDGAH